MRHDSERHHRRSNRASWWDYASWGWYFVTICTQYRAPWFGEIVDGTMQLSPAGRMVWETWNALPHRFPALMLDEGVLMPNHLHGIVVITDHSGKGASGSNQPLDPLVQTIGPRGTADGSLGRIIQAFKSQTTMLYSTSVRADGWEPFEGKLWQRNYHDHIIRDGDELARIRDYIFMNPTRWDDDDENPALTPPRDPQPA